MKKITFAKLINAKWLTRELQAAGVNVSTVAQDEVETYAEIAESDEALALTVIEAHNPEETPDILEWGHLAELETAITNELAWIPTAITDIDTGLGAVDGAFANATQRAIIRGLLQNQRRVLQEQEKELRAWRYVFRRLK